MKNRDRIHLYHSEDDMDKSSLGAYEQKLKMLLYELEKVYTYGDAESMCTDGIILNRYRKEILQLKSKLNLLGSKLVCEIPEIMPEEYMAQADTIRTQALKALEEYQGSSDYRYLMAKLFCMSKKQREQTGVMEIYGKVHSLLNAVSEDNLVVMRELGVPGMLRDQIQESVKKVRSIPLRTTEIPKKQAVKTDEDWQIQGQLNIYDLELA